MALALSLGTGGAAGTGCRRSRLPPRADGAAVVLVAPDAPLEPGVAFAREKEPNDTLAASQVVGFAGEPLALGVIGAGTASAGTKDTDLYRIVVPAGERRRMSLDVRPSAELVVAVDVLDDTGQVLVAAGGAGPGEPEGAPNLSVGPGTYFVRVRTAAPGSYRLVARLGPPDPTEEMEPNGKAAWAGDLVLAEGSGVGEIAGYFGWRKDEDWYRVALAGLPPNTVIFAELDGVEGVSASLAIHDSIEQRLAVQKGRKSERAVVRNVLVRSSEPHYFIVARAEAGRSLELRYRLRVRVEGAQTGSEGEPNDDAQHAGALTDGTVTGYLGAGDTDVFRYTAAEPAELAIEAAPPERVDIKLEAVRASDGVVLAKADAGKRRELERLPNLWIPAGDILVRLSAGKGDGNPDEPYRLTIASRPPEPGGEREPNGTAGTATALPPGVSGSGLLFPRGDVDTWRCDAAPDTEGNVAVAVAGVAGAALDSRVLSQAGKELGRFRVAAGGKGTTRVAPGSDACCLVEVRATSGKASNFRDRYTVTVGP